MTKVEMVVGENRRKAVKTAVDALSQDFLKRAQEAEYIFIKPNLVHHALQLASTHVDAVRGILDVLRMYSDAPVIVGDAAHYGTKIALRNLGFEALRDEYKNVSLCDLHEDDFVETAVKRKDGSELVVRRSKIALEAPLSISLSPMKTDKVLQANLSVTNWAEGTWLVPPRTSQEGQVWSREPWLYALGADDTHALIADMYEGHPCHMGVVDGILAMEGNGPILGTPIHMGVVLAGMDAVAVDTVASTLMGFDPHLIPYLEMCGRRSGVNEISEIDVPPLLLQEHMRPFVSPT